jgi:autoinducer 2 (AI-2) kinase
MVNEGFLAIDAGSGSVKTFLVNPRGVIIRRSEINWNRETWITETGWAMIVNALKKLEIASSSFNILGVSVTSMREKFLLIDDKQNEIKYHLSSESRAHGEKTLERYGTQMYDESGHWPVPNWIPGAILPWVNEMHSESMKNTRYVLMLSDWVNHKLTGEACTDGTSACETALFDVRNNDWNWSIIDELNLPNSIFPEVKSNSYRIGEITEKIAQITGLPHGTPVFMGGADTQCGLLGMGTKENEVAAVGGTTTPVQMITGSPVFDGKRRTWTNNHVKGKEWILESNAGYTGRAVRWALNEHGFRDYQQLNREAESIPIGSNGVLSYLGCHIFDSGPIYWETDMLGDLPVPQTVTGKEVYNRAEVARAILESNSYAVKGNIEQLEEISGAEFEFLKFCGGNSKSDLWMQIQADVLGIPIEIPETRDSTAIGTAILAAVGSGYYGSTDDAVSIMVRFRDPVTPNEEQHREYSKQYQIWLETRKHISKR